MERESTMNENNSYSAYEASVFYTLSSLIGENAADHEMIRDHKNHLSLIEIGYVQRVPGRLIAIRLAYNMQARQDARRGL
jgi:hypothetical protein